MFFFICVKFWLRDVGLMLFGLLRDVGLRGRLLDSTRSARSRASEREGLLVSFHRRFGVLFGVRDAPDNVLDGLPDALPVPQALDVLPLPCKSAVQVVPICS